MSMNNSGQKQSFLDRGTLTALVLVGIVWFGWTKWVEKTYPQAPIAPSESQKTEISKAVTQKPAQSVTAAQSTPQVPAVDPPGAASSAPAKAEVKTPLVTSHLMGTVSSYGMGFSSVELKGFKTRENKPIVLGLGMQPLFSTSLVGVSEPLNFAVKSISESEWIGTAEANGFRIEKKIIVNKEGPASGLSFRIVTRAYGDLAQFSGFRVSLSDQVKPPGGGSFFAPSVDHHDWYVRYDDTKERGIVDPSKPVELAHKNVSAIALSSHYFSSALSDRSPLRPEVKTLPIVTTDGVSVASAFVDTIPLTKTEEFVTEQLVYLGAKDVDLMRAADVGLEGVIDYGMFAVIAEPLLWLLRFFHSLFGNWGFAIIGLTLVVRALVMPFNIYSFKSMKVMQRIQPQIQQVRERLKDDPRRMNEEVMKLMREHKANPLGGCLPMLLQLPVFFALYQVLAASIELYKQPFIFWIHDLSVRDPYFVLPVLMGISMFVQQKITPVADPQQAKILMWMPIVFSFLMFSLPSGLTLYIFVSTVFGIVQQYVFMRDKSAAHPQKTVREANA